MTYIKLWNHLKISIKLIDYKLFVGLGAKTGLIEHIWPVRFHLTYITKQQVFNSGFGWSIY